ncbi:MAG TPA: response regulator [Chthoniobacterales bacterium]|jgi:CheY-like chemotaxis protein
MRTPDNGDPSRQTLRLAQLEIKMLREQLLKAIDEARIAREAAQKLIAAPPAQPPPAETMPVPAEVPPNDAETGTTADGGENRVLCIEDSEANFKLIETILTDRTTTKLLWAETGRSGLELAKSAKPHLILLDLDLPDMHGSEVLAHLRAYPTTARTPVIVISADATPSQIERMLTAGARDYLTKPFEIRRFLLTFDEVFPVNN